MSHCMSACKTIVMMCEEARSKGKKVIRINKIEDIADEAVLADTEEQLERGNVYGTNN